MPFMNCKWSNDLIKNMSKTDPIKIEKEGQLLQTNTCGPAQNLSVLCCGHDQGPPKSTLGK